MYKTLKLRIKDKHSKVLLSLAREVNFVWNYINDLSYNYFKKEKKFLSAFDLNIFTTGSTEKQLDKNTLGLNLHSQTIQAINEEFVVRRKQFKRYKLNWRVSDKNKSRYSLGWIPFKSIAIKYINGQIKYRGKFFSFWDSYNLSNYIDKIKNGCFVEDARGRWYLCLTVKVFDKDTENNIKLRNQSIKKSLLEKTKEELFKDKSNKNIGIDLGLKNFCVLSNGDKYNTNNNYRLLEAKISAAQRAKNKKLIRNLHTKVKNKRNDEQHKLSSKLVQLYDSIFVGNVSPSKLAKTKMAKSVLDKGWSQFRNMLKYKCEYAGNYYEEVNESFTTQTCSHCGIISNNSPKGRKGLGIRVWTCSCGQEHDRDVNSAKNIFAVGHGRLAEGIALVK